VLPADVADTWLGGHFEVVTLAVLPRARRAGIGRRLMRTLTADLPHDRRLLMTTSDATDPARLLYDDLGWQVIGPGLDGETVIMAKRVTAGTE
jgi:ribosomal protein S18 acetylase RimI-like enzyme